MFDVQAYPAVVLCWLACLNPYCTIQPSIASAAASARTPHHPNPPEHHPARWLRACARASVMHAGVRCSERPTSWPGKGLHLLNASWSCCAVWSRISDCFSARLRRAQPRLWYLSISDFSFSWLARQNFNPLLRSSCKHASPPAHKPVAECEMHRQQRERLSKTAARKISSLTKESRV